MYTAINGRQCFLHFVKKAEPPIQPDILTSFFRIVVEGKYKNTDVDLLSLIDGVFS